MRALLFFFGLLLVGLGLGGEAVLPSAGSSTKSALPGVVMGVVVWLFGPEARLATVAFGVALIAVAIALYFRRRSSARRGGSTAGVKRAA